MSGKLENRYVITDPDGLNMQQRSFVMHLLGSENFNITEAARRAGYSDPRNSGYMLMRSPKIQAAIGREQTQRNEKMRLTNEELLTLIETWATYDPADLCDEHGMMITDDLSKIPASVRKCINGLKIKQAIDENGIVYQQIEMKFVDRVKAAKLAMQHRGLLRQNKQKAKQEFNIDWDRFTRPIKIEIEVDEIEEAIANPEKVLGLTTKSEL
ncbi:MAG: terminase small subunit [Planctomycetota bacterium]|nr:terminase small subunit [Planctomycetota bacterium]MDA1215193.1 terminase small subunit [Planctomycetota bacterium]